jgi:hypothetical protein
MEYRVHYEKKRLRLAVYMASMHNMVGVVIFWANSSTSPRIGAASEAGGSSVAPARCPSLERASYSAASSSY